MTGIFVAKLTFLQTKKALYWGTSLFLVFNFVSSFRLNQFFRWGKRVVFLLRFSYSERSRVNILSMKTTCS